MLGIIQVVGHPGRWISLDGATAQSSDDRAEMRCWMCCDLGFSGAGVLVCKIGYMS